MSNAMSLHPRMPVPGTGVLTPLVAGAITSSPEDLADAVEAIWPGGLKKFAEVALEALVESVESDPDSVQPLLPELASAVEARVAAACTPVEVFRQHGYTVAEVDVREWDNLLAADRAFSPIASLSSEEVSMRRSALLRTFGVDETDLRRHRADARVRVVLAELRELHLSELRMTHGRSEPA